MQTLGTSSDVKFLVLLRFVKKYFGAFRDIGTISDPFFFYPLDIFFFSDLVDHICDFLGGVLYTH